jgi:hypothetical protein
MKTEEEQVPNPPLPRIAACQSVKFAHGRFMVNTHMVNARMRSLILQDFREIFRFFGRFLRFKNPVKYTHNLPVNQYFAAAHKPGISTIRLISMR